MKTLSMIMFFLIFTTPASWGESELDKRYPSDKTDPEYIRRQAENEQWRRDNHIEESIRGERPRDYTKPKLTSLCNACNRAFKFSQSNIR